MLSIQLLHDSNEHIGDEDGYSGEVFTITITITIVLINIVIIRVAGTVVQLVE